jgi:hypothetical protein
MRDEPSFELVITCRTGRTLRYVPNYLATHESDHDKTLVGFVYADGKPYRRHLTSTELEDVRHVLTTVRGMPKVKL